MGSAAKFAKAERDLKSARPLGIAAQQFYKSAEIATEKEQPKELYVAMTSDRGLAGAVHGNVNKAIRAKLEAKLAAGESLDNVRVLCVGDKSRAFFQRFFPKQIVMVGSEIGRLPPTRPLNCQSSLKMLSAIQRRSQFMILLTLMLSSLTWSTALLAWSTIASRRELPQNRPPGCLLWITHQRMLVK